MNCPGLIRSSEWHIADMLEQRPPPTFAAARHAAGRKTATYEAKQPRRSERTRWRGTLPRPTPSPTRLRRRQAFLPMCRLGRHPLRLPPMPEDRAVALPQKCAEALRISTVSARGRAEGEAADVASSADPRFLVRIPRPRTNNVSHPSGAGELISELP